MGKTICYMGDNEIAASYRTAANKSAQIQVLADLNACTKRQMRAKLIDLGLLDAKEREKYRAAHPHQGRTHLTDEEQAERYQAVADGKTLAEMAAMFGVTRSAIGDWCRQHGVKPTLDPKSTHYRRMQNAD